MKKLKLGDNGCLILTAAVFGLGFIATLCLVLPALRLTDSNGLNYELLGMSVTFGLKAFEFDLAFNILTFLGYFLALAATVLVVLGFFKNKKILFFIGLPLFILAAILIILEKNFFMMFNPNISFSELKLMFGPIIGFISAILASLSTLALILFKN